MKSFRDLLKQEEPVLGLYISSLDPSTVELAKRANFDFIRIDDEHTLFDYSTLSELIRTATLLDMPVQVRVSRLDDVTKLLDFGATGIVVPDVNTAERAKEAVEVTKFSPLGSRGVFPPGRCVETAGCSSFAEYLKIANDIVSLAIQIEDIKVVECIDEIASLEGVDILSSGKADISQSVGVPGQTDHPRVKEAEELIIKKALEYGKQPVVMAGNRNRIKELHSMGVKAFMAGVDGEIILKAFRDNVRELKGVETTCR